MLGKSNIKYDFDAASGAITVSESDYFDAKMKLAAAGLPKSAPDGDSMISSMPMGASRAVEGEKLRAAREMDLARTIEAIDAVQQARVHLAIEAPSIFLRERTKPTASVMLHLVGGRVLSEQQVEAIVHLVASSVSDMAPDGVSVVDQNGRLLSATTGPGAETDRQIQTQTRIEDRYRQAVTALLTPIVGAAKFSVEAHAEVNFAERQATRETYPQDEQRLRSETGSWNADPNAPGGGGAAPGGIPGALQPNAPPTPTGPGAPPPALTAQQAGATQGPPAPGDPKVKTAETFNRDFALGREVSVTRDAVGTVSRLSIAVALDNGTDGKPRTPQEIAALEALVKGAVGFDQAQRRRGRAHLAQVRRCRRSVRTFALVRGGLGVAAGAQSVRAAGRGRAHSRRRPPAAQALGHRQGRGQGRTRPAAAAGRQRDQGRAGQCRRARSRPAGDARHDQRHS